MLPLFLYCFSRIVVILPWMFSNNQRLYNNIRHSTSFIYNIPIIYFNNLCRCAIVVICHRTYPFTCAHLEYKAAAFSDLGFNPTNQKVISYYPAWRPKQTHPHAITYAIRTRCQQLCQASVLMYYLNILELQQPNGLCVVLNSINLLRTSPGLSISMEQMLAFPLL